jgi:glycerophosphoryl diester phosphodiesterase
MKNMIFLFLAFALASYIILSLNDIKLTSHNERHLGSSNNFVAHRGYSSLEYENSYESITLANDSECVDAVEVDVRMTNDGYLVLSHNNKIKTEISKNKVSDMTYEEFMNVKLTKEISIDAKNNVTLDIKEKYAKGTVADIHNVLDIVKTKTLILDIKYNKYVKTLNKKLIKIIKNYNNVIVQSTNIKGLNDLKNRNRNLKIQYIIDEPGDFYNINDSLYGIAIRHNLIKYNYVKYYINKGLKVYAWTINDIETYEKVFKESREFSNKINYITDYPNILCRYDIKKFIKI